MLGARSLLTRRTPTHRSRTGYKMTDYTPQTSPLDPDWLHTYLHDVLQDFIEEQRAFGDPPAELARRYQLHIAQAVRYYHAEMLHPMAVKFLLG